MECCHNDGTRDNNRLDNLRWDTPSANAVDRFRHGTMTLAKLTEVQIAPIWADLVAGARPEDVAQEHGSTEAAIEFIRSGRTWRHITRHLPGSPQVPRFQLSDTSEETWRTLPGWPAYALSDLGRLASRWAAGTGQPGLVDSWAELSPTTRKDGFRTFVTTRAAAEPGPGRRESWLLHSAILTAFVGPRPLGKYAIHEDGDRSNNRLSNLTWGARRFGRARGGEQFSA
jgi:hypothetical protein